jgi:hypothetical protein
VGVERITGGIGKGLVAGLAGTAAMTAATTLESRLTGRAPSVAPAQAVETVVGVEPDDEQAEQRLSNMTHWAYGTGWGLPRAVLSGIGLPGPVATVAHFAAVWGAALTMLPALRIAPPPGEWGGEELAKDAVRHLVYAVAAGVTYAALSRRDRARRARSTS